MSIINTGSSPIDLNLASTDTYLQFVVPGGGFDATYIVQQPDSLAGGGAQLGVGLTGQLVFTINRTGNATGVIVISGRVEGTDGATATVFDDTFDGIHALNWFDYSLLIPYFVLLSILAFYGLHRYEVIWGYIKSKRNRVETAPTPFASLPRVTIQLPLYNERLVVERLLVEVVKIHYPRELLDIQILDDSTDDTHPFTERLVAEYKAAGHPMEYIHRTNRHGFKAGALEAGLAVAKGEFVAVFDADFVIPPDFLMKTIHHFTDPEVGMVSLALWLDDIQSAKASQCSRDNTGRRADIS
jgi:hypothetical protein